MTMMITKRRMMSTTTTKANECWPHLLVIAIERPLVFVVVNGDTMMTMTLMWTMPTT